MLEKLAVSEALLNLPAPLLAAASACSPCSHAVHEHEQEGNLRMGSWQMVLWQPRFLFAETGALCYQKITADEVHAPHLLPPHWHI